MARARPKNMFNDIVALVYDDSDFDIFRFGI